MSYWSMGKILLKVLSLKPNKQSKNEMGKQRQVDLCMTLTSKTEVLLTLLPELPFTMEVQQVSCIYSTFTW